MSFVGYVSKLSERFSVIRVGKVQFLASKSILPHRILFLRCFSLNKLGLAIKDLCLGGGVGGVRSAAYTRGISGEARKQVESEFGKIRFLATRIKISFKNIKCFISSFYVSFMLDASGSCLMLLLPVPVDSVIITSVSANAWLLMSVTVLGLDSIPCPGFL